MKLFSKLAAAAAVILGLSSPAFAGAVMCSSDAAGQGTGSRTVGGSTSAVPSGKTYTLNSQGCAWVIQQDVGYFASQGYTAGPNTFTVSMTGLTAQSTTSNSPVLPPWAAITNIMVQETAGQAITGGIDIGIAGSSDATIVSAFACPASCLLMVPNASILRRIFGPSGVASGAPSSQQIFFNAHTNWSDAATLNATIFYSLAGPL